MNAPRLVCFELDRALTLLDLTGKWITRAGASTAIHSGSRARARRWSQALYDAFPGIEGIAYCSSMNANLPAFAFYERASTAMPTRPLVHRALADPVLTTMLNNAARQLRYLVV
jgi:hypothetical protein